MAPFGSVFKSGSRMFIATMALELCTKPNIEKNSWQIFKKNTMTNIGYLRNKLKLIVETVYLVHTD
jgi:hypothetical protein